MTMAGDARWIPVASRDDIPLREGRRAIVGEREVAVFNLGDRFLALDNRCPHRGGPLCDGIVAGRAIVCPLHAWKIDLETGRVQRPAEPAACTKAYATRLDGNTVCLAFPCESDARGGEERGLEVGRPEE